MIAARARKEVQAKSQEPMGIEYLAVKEATMSLLLKCLVKSD